MLEPKSVKVIAQYASFNANLDIGTLMLLVRANLFPAGISYNSR
jgi:hypothetical protein